MNPISIRLTFALALLNFTTVQGGRVLISLYALKLGADPFVVGVLAAMSSVLPTLLSWQVGRLSDRFGSRWPLMFGAAGGALGMLAPYFMSGLPALYIAAVTNGLLLAFCGVSLQNLVGLLSSRGELSGNFSNFSLMASAANFVGPLLAGFSVDLAGPAVACLCFALLSFAPVVLLAIWGGVLPDGSRDVPPSGSVRKLLMDSGLWRVLATSSLVMTGIALFQFYLPVYGHGIGLSASAIGVVLAIFAAAAFIVRMILPRLIGRLGEEKLLAFSFFLGAASLMVVPFFQSVVALGLASFAFGLGMGCGQPITMMMTFSGSAEGRSGELLGLRITANHVARMIGPLVFGMVGAAFGVSPVFWINALILASGGVIAAPGAARRKRTGP
ncbi:MAG: MFS transporter [Deltaproteobacteria bacterium]|nr:MFS transporter [Deltaproteobacteria bacterium]